MTGTILFAILSVVALTFTVHNVNSVRRLPLWPEISCHDQYDHTLQTTLPMANTVCRDGTQTRKLLKGFYGISDKKGCILWRLQGLIVREVGDNRTFEFVENKGLRKSLLTIFSGLYAREMNKTDNLKRRAFVNSLMEKSADCKPLLNEFANVKMLPSNKWVEFYECVNAAWKCSDGKDTNDHSSEPTAVPSKKPTTLALETTTAPSTSTILIPVL